MSKQKYFYAVVHRETGSFPVISGALPIYWLRKVAKQYAKGNYIVQKVPAGDLQALILKHPNPKAI